MQVDIRDAGSIPVSGRSPGGGHSNPLQYSCLENPMDRRVRQATVHRVARSRTRLKWLGMHTRTTSSSNLHTGWTHRMALDVHSQLSPILLPVKYMQAKFLETVSCPSTCKRPQTWHEGELEKGYLSCLDNEWLWSNLANNTFIEMFIILSFFQKLKPSPKGEQIIVHHFLAGYITKHWKMIDDKFYVYVTTPKWLMIKKWITFMTQTHSWKTLQEKSQIRKI